MILTVFSGIMILTVFTVSLESLSLRSVVGYLFMQGLLCRLLESHFWVSVSVLLCSGGLILELVRLNDLCVILVIVPVVFSGSFCQFLLFDLGALSSSLTFASPCWALVCSASGGCRASALSIFCFACVWVVFFLLLSILPYS